MLDDPDPVAVGLGVPAEVVHDQFTVLHVLVAVPGQGADQLVDVGQDLVEEVHAHVGQPVLSHLGQQLDGVVFQTDHHTVIVTKPAQDLGDADQERLSPPEISKIYFILKIEDAAILDHI